MLMLQILLIFPIVAKNHETFSFIYKKCNGMRKTFLCNCYYLFYQTPSEKWALGKGKEQ